MRIIEIIKSNHIIRILINLIQIMLSIIMAGFNKFDGVFFYISIPLLVIGLYYLISNLALIRSSQIISIESKSKSILWIILSTIVLISFVNLISNNYLDSRNWSLLFLWQFLNGIIIELRRKIFVVSNKSVLRYGYPWRTRIKYLEIVNVKEESDMITIQSMNKDFIVIDKNLSTQNERQRISINIDKIRQRTQLIV